MKSDVIEMEKGKVAPMCVESNDFNGNMGARISSIFVIFVAGLFGALFPVISKHFCGYENNNDIPQKWYSYKAISRQFFFAAKYFGSGVIIATALIHLLQPANGYLTNECLGESWNEYPAAYGIALGSLFMTFFVDLVSRKYLEKRGVVHTHGGPGLADRAHQLENDEMKIFNSSNVHKDNYNIAEVSVSNKNSPQTFSPSVSNYNGKSNILHDFQHPNCLPVTNNNINNNNNDSSSQTSSADEETVKARNLAMQLGSIFILEFGIIFHSVFIGLSLAVSGNEFTSLYIVITFHQLFEGLGLGTRLATAPWPKRKPGAVFFARGNKWWLPWALALAFGLTAPIAIAIGIGVRTSYPPGSRRSLITNGVFDAVSAGILLYAGLVELIGNEFLNSEDFSKASLGRLLAAYGYMCLGAGLMALLGKWI